MRRKWADIVPYDVKPLLEHGSKAASRVQLAEEHSSFLFANSTRLLTRSPLFLLTLRFLCTFGSVLLTLF